MGDRHQHKKRKPNRADEPSEEVLDQRGQAAEESTFDLLRYTHGSTYAWNPEDCGVEHRSNATFLPSVPPHKVEHTVSHGRKDDWDIKIKHAKQAIFMSKDPARDREIPAFVANLIVTPQCLDAFKQDVLSYGGHFGLGRLQVKLEFKPIPRRDAPAEEDDNVDPGTKVCISKGCPTKIGHDLEACLIPTKCGHLAGCTSCNSLEHNFEDCRAAQERGPDTFDYLWVFTNLASTFHDRKRRPACLGFNQHWIDSLYEFGHLVVAPQPYDGENMFPHTILWDGEFPWTPNYANMLMATEVDDHRVLGESVHPRAWDHANDSWNKLPRDPFWNHITTLDEFRRHYEQGKLDHLRPVPYEIVKRFREEGRLNQEAYVETAVREALRSFGGLDDDGRLKSQNDITDLVGDMQLQDWSHPTQTRPLIVNLGLRYGPFDSDMELIQKLAYKPKKPTDPDKQYVVRWPDMDCHVRFLAAMYCSGKRRYRNKQLFNRKDPVESVMHDLWVEANLQGDHDPVLDGQRRVSIAPATQNLQGKDRYKPGLAPGGDVEMTEEGVNAENSVTDDALDEIINAPPVTGSSS
ncbi:hypothetical protein B0T14DRAFT_558029 [Immersiella caudata]|uniref:Uncharacterized protein n=1 Tax=Immersiella caudata TaxID=314043 RepID=A0AA39U4L0_9PEZI|nr:hypothetical protein B0T14DRAFT_558029 [Immersiella caudata]